MECPCCKYRGAVVIDNTEVSIDGNRNFMVYCPECRAYHPYREQDMASEY